MRCRLPLLLSTHMPVANLCDTIAAQCAICGDDIEVLIRTTLRIPTHSVVTVRGSNSVCCTCCYIAYMLYNVRLAQDGSKMAAVR